MDKATKQLISEFDNRTRFEDINFLSGLDKKYIAIMAAVVILGLYLLYLDTRNPNLFQYMIFTGIVGLLAMAFGGDKQDKKFISQHRARIKLMEILDYYQKNPSDRFFIPHGNISIPDHYDEDDMYTKKQKYWVMQVQIETYEGEIIEYTAKQDRIGDLMFWVNIPFQRKKEKVRYLATEELVGAYQALKNIPKETK